MTDFEKLKEKIIEMSEFSPYPLPKFTGTTKEEAIEYIRKYSKMAHEDVDMIARGY